MKKLVRIVFVILLVLMLTSCASKEDVNAKAKEYLGTLSISYAEGDSSNSVTKDITLGNVDEKDVTVSWTSDNEAIVVSGFVGHVNASSEDVRVMLTATLKYKDAEVKKPFSVNVKSNGPAVIEASSISINGKKGLEVGESATYVANVLPSDASNKEVVWSSTNENIVSVDSNTGLATAVSAGNAKIIAKSKSNEDISGEIEVKVSLAVQQVSIATALNSEAGSVAKVNASVVGLYAQGYMLYDETGYILYFVGANANLEYSIGDKLKVVGTLSEYNGVNQFTSEAVVEKVGSDSNYQMEPVTYTQDTISDFVSDVSFGKYVTFNVSVSSINDNYVNTNITGMEGFGVSITYPLDKNAYLEGVEYEITGYALYAKENNSVKYIYLMVVNSGAIHTVTFNTGVSELNVESITFSDYTKVTLPELYREGYIFKGWSEESQELQALSENKDYQLTAIWQERVFDAVTFETNGGSLLFENQFVIKNYNTFAGYEKKYDCFTIYKKGSSSKAWASSYYVKFFLKETENGSNLYKVTFMAGSGTDITEFLDGNTYEYDYIMSSNSNNAEHALFTTLYEDEQLKNYYFGFIVPENCPAVCNIKVVYGLEKNKVDITNLKFEDSEKLPSCEKDNYSFFGWYDNPQFTGNEYNNHVGGKNKYYAWFLPTDFSITYELNGGNTTETLTSAYTIESEDIILPGADKMSKEDATFLGWFDNAEAGGSAIEKISKGSFGDITLYACWAEKSEKELQLSSVDVSVFNKIMPNIIVVSGAKTANYKLVGEGLASKYNDYVYQTGKVFSTLEAALLGASENDVIYLMAGTYDQNVAINISGIQIIGPNYGVIGKAERNNEAIIGGQVTIEALGVKIDGIRLSDTSKLILKAGNFTIQNSYINSIPTRIGTNNRCGAIVGSDAEGVVLENITIKSNYVKVQGSSAAYTKQMFSFVKVTNLTIANNYFINDATAQGTANTGVSMIYNPDGVVEIVGNEFHMLSDYAVLRMGFNGDTSSLIRINDNKFYSNADGKPAGMIFIANNSSKIEFIGNTFTYTTANPFRLQNFTGEIDIKYNAFLGAKYSVAIANSTGWEDPNTAKYNYENNYFLNGVDDSDTTGAKEATKYDSINDLETAYLAYKESHGTVEEYNIIYVLNGGTCEEELVSKYTSKSEEIVLPTQEKMSITDGTFVGWYDNKAGLGEKITSIPKGSIGDITLYAVWNIVKLTEIEVSENELSIISKYGATLFVKADASEAKYKMQDKVLTLGTDLFTTLEDALATITSEVALEKVVIYVFSGEYAVSKANIFPNTEKYIQVVGPNAELNGKATRVNEASIKFDNIITCYGKMEFIGLTLHGKNAKDKTTASTNYFETGITNNELLSYLNCVIYDFRTMVYYKDAGTKDTLVKFEGCYFYQIGQFTVWTDAKATNVKKIIVDGCTMDFSNCCQISAATNAMFRIRSASEFIFTGNVINGTSPDGKGTLFEFSSSIPAVIKYNTFINVTARVIHTSSTQGATFDENLYINNDAVLSEVPACFKATNITNDVTLCTSEEDRASRYEAYKKTLV